MMKEKFENKLKQIFFYTSRYGIVKYASDNNSEWKFNPKKFFKLCLEGFKIAQDKILTQIRNLQKEKLEIKKKIKLGLKSENLIKKIEFYDYKEKLLRNLAFTIVWQIFNGKREIIARFYTGEKGHKELNGKGFESIVNVATDINKNLEKFALITDLTSNIQIGDLIVVSPDRFEIIEIKTGTKNKEALRILNFYKINNIEISQERLNKLYDTKFAQQILRIYKQEYKAERVKTIIENDRGVDPKEKNVIVELMDSYIYDTTYHNEIVELLKKLEKKDWAYTNIQGIINIGVYKNDWRIYGKKALKLSNRNYPVYDLMSSLGITIAEPLFVKPFSDDMIIDIALGKIKIYIGIDFDNFIKFSNYIGLPIRWSTRKEYSKFIGEITNYHKKEIFVLNNKGLLIEYENTKDNLIFIGHGMILRMIFDHIKPSTLIMNRMIGFKNLKIN